MRREPGPERVVGDEVGRADALVEAAEDFASRPVVAAGPVVAAPVDRAELDVACVRTRIELTRRRSVGVDGRRRSPSTRSERPSPGSSSGQARKCKTREGPIRRRTGSTRRGCRGCAAPEPGAGECKEIASSRASRRDCGCRGLRSPPRSPRSGRTSRTPDGARAFRRWKIRSRTRASDRCKPGTRPRRASPQRSPCHPRCRSPGQRARSSCRRSTHRARQPRARGERGSLPPRRARSRSRRTSAGHARIPRIGLTSARRRGTPRPAARERTTRARAGREPGTCERRRPSRPFARSRPRPVRWRDSRRRGRKAPDSHRDWRWRRR